MERTNRKTDRWALLGLLLTLGLMLASPQAQALPSRHSTTRGKRVDTGTARDRALRLILRPSARYWRKQAHKKRARNKRLPRVALARLKATRSKALPAMRKLPVRSLQGVLKAARKDNLDLQVLRQRLKQAQWMRTRAWVALVPTLKAIGSYTRNEREVTFDPSAGLSIPIPGGSGGSSDPVVITPQDQLSMQLQMNWGFFNLQTIPMIQSAILRERQTRWSAQQTQRELMVSIVRAYYNVLLADGMVKIARRSWHNAQQHKMLAKSRQRAGLATSLDAMRATLDVLQARRSWLNAHNSARNARLSLAALLNSKDFPFQGVRPTRPKIPKEKTAYWVSLARRQRVELRSGRLAVSLAQKQIQQSWMQFFPIVSLSGGVRLANPSGFNDEIAQWSISLNASWSLFDGGARYLSLRDGYSKLTQARLEQRKLQRQIDNEVKRALIDLNNARMTLQVASEQQRLAQATYKLQQQRYRSGMATPVAVSDGLNQLFRAQVTLLREQLQVDLAIWNLRRAVGAISL